MHSAAQAQQAAVKMPFFRHSEQSEESLFDLSIREQTHESFFASLRMRAF
jgi:hypothetical protein